MRVLIITLLLVCISMFSCAQKSEKTKQFFDKIISEKPYNDILKNVKIIIKDVDLENITTEKYRLRKVFKDIDFNCDGINDLLLLIEKYVEEDDNFKVKEAFRYNYRILLVLIYQKENEYILKNKFISILNQNTEGLLTSYILTKINIILGC